MSAIVFTGTKGGVGVTTLAVNVAASMSRRGHTRLLSIGDGRDWSLHLRALANRTIGRVPASWTPAGASNEPFWTDAVLLGETLEVAAIVDGDLVSVDHLAIARDAIEASEEAVVVVDAGPVRAARALGLAPGGVLVNVIGADAVSLTAALNWRKTLTAYEENRSAWTVLHVLNLVDPRRPLCRDLEAIAMEALGEDLVVRMRTDASVANAVADGALIADHAPDSQTALDLAALVSRLDPRPEVAVIAEPLSA